MRTVHILAAAAEEALEAATWYERERPGLGREFSYAVDAALDLIEDEMIPLSPMVGEASLFGAKRLILKRFPYDVIAIERGDATFVVAIAHHSRRPGYWKKRIGV